MNIRTASLDDLDALYKLEVESFSAEVASDKRSIKRSILSAHQIVIAIEEIEILGSAIMHIHKKSMRLYSIAVSKKSRNTGVGRLLLEYCEALAKEEGKDIMTLEADADNIKLINWYSSNGYGISKFVEDYYGEDAPAYLMIKRLINPKQNKDKIKNLVIVDEAMLLGHVGDAQIVTARDYINSELYQSSRAYRVFNFCRSYDYQSIGYYISLLAEARGQRVFPSVATMQDIASKSLVKVFAEEIKDDYFEEYQCVSGEKVKLKVILGCDHKGKTSRLSKSLYKLFDAPFVEYTFVRGESWLLEKVRLMTVDEVIDDKSIPFERITAYSFSRKVFSKRRLTNYQYSLAILVNPYEAQPPSDKIALEKFRASALANGFYTEFITKEDAGRINEFDAVFLRETTAVNNHTYEIARQAQTEGLIVIDDPWSILKCTNKFYLYERMKQGKVPMPNTKIISRLELESDDFGAALTYPVILKRPDSAFSLGVFKVKSKEELRMQCEEILKETEFAIIQEYIKSDFDWRVGILNNEVLFVCKYFMAKDHWQIYNWNADGEDTSGLSETVPVDEAPEIVLDTALKATALIGDGLYGVDLKHVDDKCYLIEVNDNPNIDSGIEDAVLGDVLYDRIVRVIKSRIIESQKDQKSIIV